MRLSRQIFVISLGAAGAILLVVFLIILRIEGSKREVIAYRAALEAKGETLSATKLAASAPTESNEAANQLAEAIAELDKENKAKPFKPHGLGMQPAKPGTAEITHLRPTVKKTGTEVPWSELEKTMGDYAPHLDRVKEITQSQTPVFRVEYAKGFAVNHPHLSAFLRLGQMLGADSMLDLRAGRPGDAVRNIKTTLLLAKVSESQHTFINQLVSASLIGMAAPTTWDFLQASASAEDLESLQKSWEQLAVAKSVIPAVRMERSWTAAAFTDGDPSRFFIAPRTSSKMPTPAEMWEIAKGEFQMRTSRYSDELASLKGFEELIDLTESPDWRSMATGTAAIKTSTDRFPLSKQIFESLLNSLERIASTDTTQKLAITAIAIRRYQIDHSGNLPETLEVLVPKYLAAAPLDIMSGAPLHYKLESAGYLLYGVGFDGVDDGGNPEAPAGKKYRSFIDGRDIVWPMPVASPPESKSP
jgi:hypothetical protein